MTCPATSTIEPVAERQAGAVLGRGPWKRVIAGKGLWLPTMGDTEPNVLVTRLETAADNALEQYLSETMDLDTDANIIVEPGLARRARVDRSDSQEIFRDSSE